jgi:chaperonin GroES
MQFRPLADRVLVKRHEARETTEGGIIIPQNAQERPTRGTVVAAGPGKTLDNGKLVPLQVKVGDEVFFGEYSGTEVELEGESYFILRDDEIMGFAEEG